MENTAKQYQEETISAVCTALGEGAIGIIRISGENALAAGEAIFKAASGRKLADYPVNTLVYGHVYDADGSMVDEVMAVYMRLIPIRQKMLWKFSAMAVYVLCRKFYR